MAEKLEFALHRSLYIHLSYVNIWVSFKIDYVPQSGHVKGRRARVRAPSAGARCVRKRESEIAGKRDSGRLREQVRREVGEREIQRARERESERTRERARASERQRRGLKASESQSKHEQRGRKT